MMEQLLFEIIKLELSAPAPPLTTRLIVQSIHWSLRIPYRTDVEFLKGHPLLKSARGGQADIGSRFHSLTIFCDNNFNYLN